MNNKNKSRMWQYGSLLLCSILCVVFLAIPVRAADLEEDIDAAETTKANVTAQSQSEVVKAAWYEDSYHITDKNGSRSGYGYEYEQAVSAYTGWDYDYVTGNWEELLEKLQNGEIDLMSSLSYTDERAKTMLFSDLPMGEEKYYLYADLANSDISASDISSLNGQSVAMMENSVQATQFYDWEEKYHIKTKHVFVNSMDQAKEMFAKHEVQGVISTETSIWVNTGLSAVFTIGGSEIYYGINKKRPDLKEELDSAMRAMENDKPFYSDDLYKQYIATQSVAALSSDEQEWLKQHGAIRIGYLENDPGFSAVDPQSGKLMGVVNDYIEYAWNCFEQPLEFDLVGLDSQEALIQAVRDNKIDMIFHINQNPYYAEENGVALSNTVLSIPLAAVTAQGTFDESAENTVAIAKENSKYKWYVTYNYPNWNIKEYNSIKDAEQAVRNGKADCFIARSGQAMDYVNDKKMHSVFLTKTVNTSFAVDKGNTLLMSILNKTLKSIQTSKLTGAVTMYEDSLKKVTFNDFVKDNFLKVIILFSLTFILILGMFIYLLKKAKAAERKARESQTQAENANAAKSVFLFNMSHDIRTPMNALLGYNQLMKKELTDPKLLHYQRAIENSGNLLLAIINNVLDMARIESGRVELDESYARIDQTMDEVKSVFEPQADKKGLNLIFETQVEHPYVLCDITKTKQILVNLISNAVKYTPAGGTVTVAVQEFPCEQENSVKIQIEVRDTGIGMSKEFLPTLFDSFSRERNTTVGKVAGTGLGMAIVKKYADLMGGSIDVKSELGEGTVFTLILTQKKADENYYGQKASKTDAADMEISLRGKHILLAEDNELNAEIAIAILEETGLIIEWVEDGVQCVNQIEQMPAGTYDMILMDIQMPNMGGYEATKCIRHLQDIKKAEIPIIAMTANAFQEDAEKCIAVGMNAHLAKPLDIEKVEQTICKQLRDAKNEKLW